MRTGRGTAAAAVLMIACGAGLANAETHDVSVGPGFTFSPANVEINLGDTVRWTWAGGLHNVESGVGGTHDGNFRSGEPTSANGTVFELTFDEAFLDANPMPDNLYPYYCAIHFGGGMAGGVTVIEPAACFGDFDNSGGVNVFDLLDLLGVWGECAKCPQDLDEDGVVNLFDLLDLLAAWGEC